MTVSKNTIRCKVAIKKTEQVKEIILLRKTRFDNVRTSENIQSAEYKLLNKERTRH